VAADADAVLLLVVRVVVAVAVAVAQRDRRVWQRNRTMGRRLQALFLQQTAVEAGNRPWRLPVATMKPVKATI
jgi:cytochrome c biogenesis protein ResB